MVLFSTQILPFRTASANHCCTLMAASLKRMIMIMIKTAMTLLNIVMSNRQRFSHYLTQIWSTNVLLLRFFRKKIKMKIISKNMIVTTIPSGGANVNLFFALFPRADKMLIGSIIASGFRDKKHSRNDAEDILRIAHLKIAYLGWAILIFTYHFNFQLDKYREIRRHCQHEATSFTTFIMRGFKIFVRIIGLSHISAKLPPSFYLPILLHHQTILLLLLNSIVIQNNCLCQLS